jgi:hypothetical protein
VSDADTMTSLLHAIDRLDGDEIRRCLQEDSQQLTEAATQRAATAPRPPRPA